MFEIEIVPALSDNYVYIAHDAAAGATAVVDPAEARRCSRRLSVGASSSPISSTPTTIFDHIGGNAELVERYGAPVIGPRADAARIPGLDVEVGDGDSYTVGTQTARVFDVPGHTSGHIAFWFEESRALFCGDTLFALGCGRMFEGTPEQFWSSLGKLRALPDDTRVYCGHEYTQSNARFAISVDPDNEALQAACRRVDELRSRGERTIPSELGEEKLANPFLRADLPDMQRLVGMEGAAPEAVFAEIRRRKDNF